MKANKFIIKGFRKLFSINTIFPSNLKVFVRKQTRINILLFILHFKQIIK